MRPPSWAIEAQRRADQRKGNLARAIGFGRFVFAQRRYQSSPDKGASRERRRVWSRNMPACTARKYSEALRAVGGVIAKEIKRTGICDWPVDKIAAIAGVCRATVQTFLRSATCEGDIAVVYRQIPGAKNLTNLVKIQSNEWLEWIRRGPVVGPSIGPKSLDPSESQASILEGAIDKLRAAMTPPWMKRLIDALETVPAQPP